MYTSMKIVYVLFALCGLVVIFVYNFSDFRMPSELISPAKSSNLVRSSTLTKKDSRMSSTASLSSVSKARAVLPRLIGRRTQASNKQVDQPASPSSVSKSRAVLPRLIGRKTQPSNKQPDDQTSHVLISSYMRSGSTFLGRILGWRADSFYFFEPLWATHQNVYINASGTHCHYAWHKCQNMSQDAFSRDLNASLQFMKSIYECKLSGYYPRIQRLINSHANAKLVGPSWDEYRKCNSTIKSKCFQKLVPVCLSAKHRVTKLLRMDLQLSSRLLMKIPNLKIVQLFRDPRGVLNSHIHTEWYPVKELLLGELKVDIRIICDRIRNDLTTARRLMKEFPGRVRIVQYEDFDDPLLKAGRLFKFLGMEFPPRTKELVTSLSSGSGKEGNHPFSYRKRLQWTSVKLLNQYCSDIYEELHYVKFQDEKSFRNLNISAIDGHLPYAL